MLILESRYNPLFVALSIVVAIFASYVALDLSNSIHQAKGRSRIAWLAGGALAMGIGIWSMHFVGMLAFTVPGVPMAYDVPLVLLSIGIAVAASGLALYVVNQPSVSRPALLSGGIAMAAAIAGMHYTGMYAMRMPAKIVWNLYWVTLSVAIALVASFAALLIAIRLRSEKHLRQQRLASIVMGLAIAGMHYAGMFAATFVYTETPKDAHGNLLATSELGWAVVGTTTIILGLAWAGSVLDRAFSARTRRFEEASRLQREAEDAVAQLERERDLRDRFVSALAHDLRTPLSAARISAQLSIRQADQPDEVARLGGRVSDSLRRMDQMLQNLLDAHRITAGQPLPLQKAPGSLRSVLENAYQDLATIHGDRFVLECPADLRGTWDAAYLQRAVENLCTNAVKYGSGGTIRIVGAGAPDDCVEISVVNRGNPIPRDGRRPSSISSGEAARNRSTANAAGASALRSSKASAKRTAAGSRSRATPRTGLASRSASRAPETPVRGDETATRPIGCPIGRALRSFVVCASALNPRRRRACRKPSGLAATGRGYENAFPCPGA